MGLNPELAMLRRFAILNTQILMHKQCELIQLEDRYRKCELRNSQSAQRPHNRLSHNAGLLHLPAVANDEQIQVLKQLEPKLREYGEGRAVKNDVEVVLTRRRRSVAITACFSQHARAE